MEQALQAYIDKILESREYKEYALDVIRRMTIGFFAILPMLFCEFLFYNYYDHILIHNHLFA